MRDASETVKARSKRGLGGASATEPLEALTWDELALHNTAQLAASCRVKLVYTFKHAVMQY